MKFAKWGIELLEFKFYIYGGSSECSPPSIQIIRAKPDRGHPIGLLFFKPLYTNYF